MAVRCQQDLLFLSQTYHSFESDLPRFDSDIQCFESDRLIFRARPSHFSNEPFPLFPVSLSRFSSQTLPFFRVSPSHFFGSIVCTFPSQSFPFFRVSPSQFSKSALLIFETDLPISSNLSIFPSQSYWLFEWDLPIFLGQFFPLFQVSPSHNLSQTFPFFWVRPSNFIQQTFIYFELILSFSSSVWYDVWLEMSTESIFFSEETGLEEIVISWRTDSINGKVRFENTANLTRKKKILLTPHSHRNFHCLSYSLLPLFIRGKLETSKIDCGDKIWKKPCLFTFSSEK